MTLAVVLDTSELTADFFLAGYYLSRLQTSLETLDARIYIPGVSFDETIADYASSRKAAIRSCELAGAQLAVLEPESSSDFALPNRVETHYGDALVVRLGEMKGEILPYPEVSHQQLVHMANQKERPFDQRVSAYRDSLVWLSVVELIAATGADIALVTGNYLAFSGDTRDSLHTDLTRRLGSILAPASVALYPDLGTFWNEYAEPRLISLGFIWREYEPDLWSDQLLERIANERPLARNISRLVAESSPGGVVPTVNGPKEVEILKAIKFGEDELDIVVRGRYELLAEPTGRLYRGDSDPRRLVSRCSAEIEGTRVPVSVLMVARVRSLSGTIESLDILGVNRT